MEKLTCWLGREELISFYNSELSGLKTLTGKIKRLEKYISEYEYLKDGILKALESIELHKKGLYNSTPGYFQGCKVRNQDLINVNNEISVLSDIMIAYRQVRHEEKHPESKRLTANGIWKTSF